MKKIIIFLLLPVFSVCQTSSFIKLQNSYLQQIFEEYSRANYLSLDYLHKNGYLDSRIPFDSIVFSKFKIQNTNQPKKGSAFFENLFRNGSLVTLTSDEKKNKISINPLFNFEYGKTKSSNLYHLNRGIRLDINLNNRIFISSSIYENQSKFPDYIQQYIDSLTVVPGMGKARYNSNKIEYALPLGFIGYKASKNFYVEVGNDKNFIGSGHRSLLLSDVAYSYPYLKLQANFGKFSFMNLWGQFTDASKGWRNLNGYDKKYASFNTLSYKGIKNLQFSLFQSIVWTNRDSLGKARDQEWGYFIPIIFLNSVNFNNGSPDNNLIGFDVNFQLKKHTVFYGQLIIDDLNIGERKNGRGFFQNKIGFQLGIKTFKAFNVENLYAQVELNTVRPYTYANKAPSINYTHYGEALAHPIGANFREILFRTNYKINRFLIEGSFMYAIVGNDIGNSHWGRNIFKSDYASQNGIFSFNNTTAQGLKTNILNSNIVLNYLMNPITNSRFSVNLTYRSEKSSFQNIKDIIVSISFSTALINYLKDF